MVNFSAAHMNILYANSTGMYLKIWMYVCMDVLVFTTEIAHITYDMLIKSWMMKKEQIETT